MSAPEKHLELIQAVISRLAGNSYAYKGWAITVAAGLVALLADKHPNLLAAALYPLAGFWFLDGHSLALERAFRRLYENALEGKASPYSMSLSGIRRPIIDQINAMLSGSLLTFYASSLIFVLVIERTLT